jgi:SAM-dependent methyltransferase
MSRYYPPDYYSVSASPEAVGRNLGKALIRRLRDSYAAFGDGAAGRRLYSRFPNPALSLLARAGLSRRSRILDVGCGAGVLLHTLREAGAETTLGIDPYLAADIEYKNGLRIRKATIEVVEGQWELVMFHHSFEHLAEPRETLRQVKRLLAPGASCLLRLPLASSYAWRRYREHWVQLDAPRHFYLHSRESLRRLAEEAGFTIAEFVYDSTEFQFWGSEQYAKGIPLSSPASYAKSPTRSLFSPVDIAYFRRRARELNQEGQGDQAAFFLRRGSSPP